MEDWPQEVELVAAFLRASGAEARIEEMPVETDTAEAAADAVGCTLSQIVKSLVFVCDGAPAVVLAPGDRRVDSAAVARVTSARRAAIARPEEVVAVTGFTPGSVAPFPLPEVQMMLLERTLLRHHVVWAGAGSVRHLVRLSPTELLRLSRGRVEDLVRPSA
jgi:prolyl-tRNA editing enzyme YbaK/EbsC (Cys-tRNA(Pro) deacylase)